MMKFQETLHIKTPKEQKKDWTLIRTSLKSAFFSEEFWGLFSSDVGRKSCKKCLKINEMSNVKRQGCTF